MRRRVPAWPVVLVTRGILALALLLAFGCSSARGPVSVPVSGQPTLPEAERLVARADALAEAGEGSAARYLYQIRTRGGLFDDAQSRSPKALPPLYRRA
jgi:hypothetical protein